MDEKKLRAILEVMQGITYLEWRKLEQAIEIRFSADASAVSNKITLADADTIMKDYK